jgi:thiamine-phosphate pyrophosphorylase
VSQARRLIGTRLWIGVSTHNLDQAEQAVLDGANYLGVGPTFASSTKHFDRWLGPARVAEITAQVVIPCFAIGGITLENVDQLLVAGVRHMAVGSAIANARSPGEAVRSFRAKLREAAERETSALRPR